jgi:hypothetical protein
MGAPPHLDPAWAGHGMPMSVFECLYLPKHPLLRSPLSTVVWGILEGAVGAAGW